MRIRLGIVLLLYTAARVLFFAFNREEIVGVPLAALAAAFLIGFHSDLLAVLLTNIPLIGLALFGRFAGRPWDERFLNVVFLVCNLPFLVINIVDFEYIKFTGERSSLALWDVRSDIPFQLGNFIFYYWRLASIGAVFIFLACFFLPNGSPRRRARYGGRTGSLASLVAGALLLVGSGFVHRAELDTADGGSWLKQLAQNSTVTVLTGRRGCAARPVSANPNALSHRLKERAAFSNKTRPISDNVVIIIVESLSSEYTGPGGYAPFLDELAARGRSFPNHFANGRRSIDALPSILLGVPRLSPATFRCTAARRFESFVSILREHGYRTLFFHGGRNGAGDFVGFARQTGFEQYFGEDEYGRPADSDGVWGIYDEPFLRFTASVLTEQREPFIAAVFTVSTHQPFKIPDEHAGRFAQGTLPIHESVGYVDHALREFFSSAEKMPWFKRTLFVITGDHTGPAAGPRRRLIDAYRVPLIFYHGGAALPATDLERVAQHVDIPASIFDYLGVDRTPLLPFGRSVFERDDQGIAVGEVDNRYWIVSGAHYLEESGPGKVHAGRLSGESLDPTRATQIKEKLLAELARSVNLFNQSFAPRHPGSASR